MPSENVSTSVAKTVLYQRLLDGWSETPVRIDGEEYDPVPGSPYVIAMLLGERSEQHALQKPGNRPYKRDATFRVQRRGPHGVGTVDEDAWVEAMKVLFEGIEVDGVRCNVSSVRPPRSDGPWRLRTVDFEVYYFERR